MEIGNIWNYKEEGKGAEFTGLYLSREEHVGENDSNVYAFETENGDCINIWGTTLLDIRLKNLKFGEEVKIVYLGTEASEKRKGKSYHNFEVYHRMPEYQPVNSKNEENIDINDISEKI